MVLAVCGGAIWSQFLDQAAALECGLALVPNMMRMMMRVRMRKALLVVMMITITMVVMMTVMPTLECGLALEEEKDGDDVHDHGDSSVEDNDVSEKYRNRLRFFLEATMLSPVKRLECGIVLKMALARTIQMKRVSIILFIKCGLG